MEQLSPCDYLNPAVPTWIWTLSTILKSFVKKTCFLSFVTSVALVILELFSEIISMYSWQPPSGRILSLKKIPFLHALLWIVPPVFGYGAPCPEGQDCQDSHIAATIWSTHNIGCGGSSSHWSRDVPTREQKNISSPVAQLCLEYVFFRFETICSACFYLPLLLTGGKKKLLWLHPKALEHMWSNIHLLPHTCAITNVSKEVLASNFHQHWEIKRTAAEAQRTGRSREKWGRTVGQKVVAKAAGAELAEMKI